MKGRASGREGGRERGDEKEQERHTGEHGDKHLPTIGSLHMAASARSGPGLDQELHLGLPWMRGTQAFGAGLEVELDWMSCEMAS